ncbi:MAG: diacylglycerol kinase family protein [Geminicoccaceae bacterium]
MTALRIAMLSNPLSRRNRHGMSSIEQVLAGRSDIRHLRFEPGMDLQAVMAELAAAETDVIILNSGDGLVHAVLGALFLGRAFATPPPLALLPRGMTNMTAADVGLGGRDAGTLRRLLQVLERGELSRHLVRRNVLKVDYDPDRPGERGMFFGAAGIYDGIHLCTGSIHTRGLTGSWASSSTILAILGRAILRGVEATGIGGDEIGISVDGGLWTTGPRTLLLATTLDRLVLGTRPFWNNGDAPIHFSVFDHPPVGVIRHAWNLVFGGKRRELPDPPFHSQGGHRVELRLDRPFTIDGEFFRAAPGTAIVITAEEEIRYVKLRP